MEKHLKKLKRSMDNTVFKDVPYDRTRSISSVLTPLDKGRKSNIQMHPSIIKNKLNFLLSISVVSLMFIGITYFAGVQLNLFSGMIGKQDSESSHSTLESPNKALDQNTVYIPPKQEENLKEMTKEEILTKMLNSVDYFETAKGEFKINYADTLGETLIEYELSLNHKAGGYSKETYITDGAKKVTILYYKDGTRWEIDENSGSYGEGKYPKEIQGNQSETLKIEDAFSVDSEGINVTNYRERPHIGQAASSLFPYEIASNYTRDLNSWDIEKQNEELLGHNTLVIKGEVDRRKFQSFRLWVDKDTGILVKYETYNSEGKIVDYLYPTKLEINVPIDSEKFKPNLAGLTKMETDKSKPRINTGDVDQSIPEELKVQWDEAKKKPNETTILHLDNNWYIFVKKGYYIDRIEVNGKEGTLYLAKENLPPGKKQFNWRAIAEGYAVDNLEIVYE
ncbi:MucB/RseB family protein [Cytobacillus firmus]|uniref:MucB/RseB family protein n=2 Tax=Cytobacillus TaxID=2675230 RepID=A0A366JBW9_CYTFI|nr:MULTISPECIES: sigma-E factor regulatory protein RseB domain-containing protein [Cytobacillus]RBP84462.1 MucB/RseB family protein [Cytobacillus firmus]TDX35062.1 MucB/RseB family protein [Cytobacillus oceanisediminis]